MRLLASIVLLAGQLAAADFELAGQILPEGQASVSLHGATAPFEAAARSDKHGRFRFRKLPQGAYTVTIFDREHGAARQTVEVGPSAADAAGRVTITLQLTPRVESNGLRRRRATISARELSIPDRARNEYAAARKSLSRSDVDKAVAHLNRAVEIAPQFGAAWNDLGTIAYQGRKYAEAERDFRRALEANAEAFAPLVNLGGVLLNLGKPEEALQHNLNAAQRRPNDALANSQLGMSYFLLGRLDSAEKYLAAARQLDPAHFSHPQLLLAEIHLRRGDKEAAIAELTDFLSRHPDAPEVPDVKAEIGRLQAK